MLSPLCVVQVPWPPQSMAESWKRRPQWEKWSSKTLRGAVRPTDQPVGRGDAHGHVFPTRGQCRSRARQVVCSCREVLFGRACHQICNKTVSIKQGTATTWWKHMCLLCCICQQDPLSVKSEWCDSLEHMSISIPHILSHNCWLVRKEFHWGGVI